MSLSVQPQGAADLPSEHEFDSQHNRTIGRLARDMRWVAIPLIFIGVLYALACVSAVLRGFAHPESLVGAAFIGLATVFYLALGVWTRRAAESFHRITQTSGRDVTHLMAALDNLGKKYALLSPLVKLYAVVVLAVLVFAAIGL